MWMYYPCICRPYMHWSSVSVHLKTTGSSKIFHVLCMYSEVSVAFRSRSCQSSSRCLFSYWWPHWKLVNGMSHALILSGRLQLSDGIYYHMPLINNNSCPTVHGEVPFQTGSLCHFKFHGQTITDTAKFICVFAQWVVLDVWYKLG